MQQFIDMHTHTNCSDGTKTPEELVEYAKQKGVSVIAITDHDTVSGLDRGQFAGKKHGVTIVNGIELSVKSDGETHILGYFINPNDTYLSQLIKEVQEYREKRFWLTFELIEQQGMNLRPGDVLKYGEQKQIGRVHFAKAMVDKGYVKSVEEGFSKYLSIGKPCCSTKQRLCPQEAIDAIRKAGGDAYLAHLHLTGFDGEVLYEYVKKLKGYGLVGLEGYYTDYTAQMQKEYEDIAQNLNLKISGGSDYHGENKPHIEMGSGRGNLEIPYSVYENMLRGR